MQKRRGVALATVAALALALVLGGGVVSAHADEGTVVTVTNEQELTEALKGAAAAQGSPYTIQLSEDIELSDHTERAGVGVTSSTQVTFAYALTDGENVHLTSVPGEKHTLRLGDELFGKNGGSVVMFFVNGTGRLTLSNLKIDANSSGDSPNKGSAACVEHGGTLTIEDGAVLTGSDGRVSGSAGALHVAYGAKLVMNGGELTGNDPGSRAGMLAVISVINSSFEMNGGTISDNTVVLSKLLAAAQTQQGRCGIVAISTDLANLSAHPDVAGSPSTFVMNGGTISGNANPKGFGGAISAGMPNSNYPEVTGVSQVIVNGGTIERNTALGGGAISVFGNEHYAGEGGYGIVLKICEGARITGNKAVLEGGDAGEGGGAIVASRHALLEVSGGEISGNYSDLSGGAVQLFNRADMVMTGGTISGNVSEAHGGGICVAATFQEGSDNASSLTMTGGTVASNTSMSVWSGEEHADDPFAPGGGGIYLHGGTKLSLGGSASVSGNVVEGHGSGGGVFACYGSYVEMTAGLIEANRSANDGGGVYVDGAGSYEGFDHWYENDSHDEGALVRMSDGRIASNVAKRNGGGIFVCGENVIRAEDSQDEPARGGTFEMTGGVVTANTAEDAGGGVYLQRGEEDVPASTFEMTGGALYFNVAGANGNVSTDAADSGAEAYAEGATTALTLPAAEEITAYVQAPGSPYVPEDDRSAWFTSWYDDYSDQDLEFGKADAATQGTGRHSGRYLSSMTIDRMAYEPAESDAGRRALILDRSTLLALEKRVAGDDAPSDETYEFEVRVENLPDVEVAGTRYPVELSTNTQNPSIGTLEGGEKDGQAYLEFDATGSARVRLAAGDALTILDLPAGARFTVTEVDRGGASSTSFSADNCGEATTTADSVTGVTTTVWRGATTYAHESSVTVVNVYEASDPTSGGQTPTPGQTTSTEADSEALPSTGDAALLAVPALFAGTAALLASRTVRRRA